MADNVPITAGSGTNIAADDVSSVFYQRVKVDGGGDGATTPILAGNGTAASALRVTLPTDGTGVVGLNAGTNNIGDVDVLTVPADPFGANADAASATGSISAKLRFIAATGIPITSIAAGDTNIGNVDVVTLPALVAGTANIGDVDVLTVPEHAGVAADVMSATSGDTFTALTSTAQAIKGSAGKLLGWYIYNPNTVVCWVVFYNIAQGSVTVGTSTPRLLLAIPAGSAANLWCQPGGISFSTAISWAAVMTTAGGNTAPTTALEANAFWI